MTCIVQRLWNFGLHDFLQNFRRILEQQLDRTEKVNYIKICFYKVFILSMKVSRKFLRKDCRSQFSVISKLRSTLIFTEFAEFLQNFGQKP